MPVAQLDRASDFESEGCRFESCRAHHKGKKMKIIKPFGLSIGKFELKKTTIAKTNNYCDFIMASKTKSRRHDVHLFRGEGERRSFSFNAFVVS